MWIPSEGIGLEHLFLQCNEEDILVDSVMIGAGEGDPFRVRYRIRGVYAN